MPLGVYMKQNSGQAYANGNSTKTPLKSLLSTPHLTLDLSLTLAGDSWSPACIVQSHS